MTQFILFIADIAPVTPGVYAIVLGILAFMGVTIAGFIFYITRGQSAPEAKLAEDSKNKSVEEKKETT